MDAATVAIGISAVAGGFSAWAAWAAHRVSAVERERRRDELAPRIRVEEPYPDEDAVWLISDGPRDYTSARCRLVSTPACPVDAISVDAGDNAAWFTDGELGALLLGEQLLIRYRRINPDAGGTVRLTVTCSSQRRGPRFLPARRWPPRLVEFEVHRPAQVFAAWG